ncbi:hypothetical protein PVIIG_06165 [Plasmodium vivax India VII]|uniref:VIR protein n=1 Tax=Plasmodium vivax India VII TaxID=1077284 RepID=A0A0J9SHH4_PLAVI|nr:hypothetical protein PVIIG_06165 [Plasmodium vivax India VII]
MSIPINVFYSKNNFENVLPTDKRNYSIFHGVKFRTILGYIQSKNIDGIESWVKKYQNTLRVHLSKKHNPRKNNDFGKYCTNLNYIIDFIVQGINNLKMFKRLSWYHRIQEISMDTLLEYPSLKCKRDLDNHKNKHLYFKKLMLDLCEDIEYIKTNNMFLKNNSKCPIILSRLKYRKDTLMDFFHAFYKKDMFNLKDKCSISFINDNFSDISCNKVEEQPNTSGASEGATVTASSSDDRADTHPKETRTGTTDENGVGTRVLQNSPPDGGLDELESVDPNPEDLEISLPFNEDPPKLDTTYAAASLAGISLFGTILYKYGPFRNRLNSRRGAINGSNIFPLDNNVYDANLMNNFEYLQTGIPNDEYQLGYGSVTDY